VQVSSAAITKTTAKTFPNTPLDFIHHSKSDKNKQYHPQDNIALKSTLLQSQLHLKYHEKGKT